MCVPGRGGWCPLGLMARTPLGEKNGVCPEGTGDGAELGEMFWTL